MTDAQFDRLIDAITRLTDTLDKVRGELNDVAAGVHDISAHLDVSTHILDGLTYELADPKGRYVLRVEGLR